MTVRGDRSTRVLVLGVAGAGKSTFALRLGRRLSAPVYHLDNVANLHGAEDPTELHAPLGHEPERPFVPRPLADRVRIVDGIAGLAHWIAEGSFAGWTGALQERAHVIVWLDHVGPREALARVLRRVRASHVRETSRHEGISRTIRPGAYLRHGAELLLELWDIAGYYWRRRAPGVDSDIKAGRWDRLSRAAVRRELEPHRDRLIHVRSAEELHGLEDRVAAACGDGAAGAGQAGPRSPVDRA